uniref:Secreted protein n=1 Tax=Anguilla anguilla TaxID=7936 RepID=A0A0E9XLK8_ANGAN
MNVKWCLNGWPFHPILCSVYVLCSEFSSPHINRTRFTATDLYKGHQDIWFSAPLSWTYRVIEFSNVPRNVVLPTRCLTTC